MRFKWFNYTLATGFGSGKSPWMPGTVGSAAALGIVWLVYPLFAWWWQLAFSVAVCGIGVWVSEQVSEHSKIKDPSMVVIDEFAGVFIAFIAVPLVPLNLVIGFTLFRIFDIWKPGPIGWLEKLPGGWGIMMDDILCGVFVNMIFLIYLFGFSH